jgi:acetyltransferase-like isoleucine patch superfamily enzyme
MAVSDIPRAQDELFRPGMTPRERYAALIVGRPGWWALVKHEVVVLVAQGVPGALGLVLRRWLYPCLLGACGRNVVFGQNVVLRHPHKIRIGNDVVIDDNCLLDAKGTSNAGIRIANGVFIGRNTILSCKNGDIELADRANVGFNCEIFSASRVQVGERTLIAAYCYLVGGDHDVREVGTAVLDQPRTSAGIRVGAGAWLGAGVTVLDGVDIGSGASVGAAAVVRESVPDNATAVGIPARIVRVREAP